MLEKAPRELVAFGGGNLLQRRHVDDLANRSRPVRTVEDELLQFRAAQFIGTALEMPGAAA